MLTAGFVAGCASSPAPPGAIAPVDRKSVSRPPAARASVVILETGGAHRVLGVGCDFFSTARSTQAHALREADSFRVRSMTAADFQELVQLVDDRGFTALFSDCKR